MYLCVCKAVSERTARRAIHAGEVVTLRDLSRQHGVGTCCGKCVPDARELLARELPAARPLTLSTPDFELATASAAA